MLASSGGTMVLNLVITLLLAYLLSPNDLGVIMAAEAFVGLFSLFFEFGFQNSIVKLAVDNKKDMFDGLNAAVGNALLTKTLISIPLIALIYFAGLWSNLAETTMNVMMIYIFITLINSYAIIFGITRRALGKFKLIAIIQVINPLLKLITVLVVLNYVGGLMALVYSFLGLSVIRLLISFGTSAHLIKPRVDKSSLGQMFKESWKYGFFDFLEDLQTRIDRVMINSFLGAASVAFYAIPAKINRFTTVIPQTASKVFLPSLHKAKSDDQKEFLQMSKELSKSMAILGGLACLVIYYFSVDILNLLYGDKYAASIPIAQLFAFISLLWFINYTPTLILAVQAAHKKRVSIQVTFTLINIALNFILIQKMGIIGAVYATLLSNIIKFILVSYFTTSMTELSRIVIITALAIISAIALPWHFGLAGFIVILFLLKLLTKQEIDFLLRVFKKRELND